MASKKRVDLSIDDKLKVLVALQTPGATIMKVTNRFNIQVSNKQNKANQGMTETATALTLHFRQEKKTGPGANWH